MRKLNTGTNSPVTKFTEQDVIEIKKMLINNVPHKEIANKFNTSMGTIGAIATDRTWIHICVDGWQEYIQAKSKKTKKKLTIEEVKEIKRLLQDKNANCSAIAREYGVYSSAISNIKLGKTFSDVEI